ncbi:MAG: flagellar hook-associated protein FlgL [Myxococcota bacterium]
MRVSDSMMFGSVQRSTSGAQARLFETAARASSQRAIDKPSDNPTAAARAVRIERVLAELDSAARTRNTVRTDLTVAESGLRSGIEVLENALELSIQMGNDSLSPTDRRAAAIAVDEHIKTLRGLANTRMEDGRYIYGGTRDGSEPYPAAGGYIGGQSSRMVNIAPGATFDSAVVGSQGFGDTDLSFKVLEDFATALRNNDLAGIQTAQEAIGRQLDATIPNLTGLGTRIQALDSMDTLAANNKLALEIQRGSIVDGDFAKLISDFNAASTAMQAATSVGKQMLAFAFGSLSG